MEIVDRIGAVAASAGDRIAHRHRDVTLTYGHLWSASGDLAARLAGLLPDDGSPIVVYGHKESSMIVAFLGAVRAAHPYIPVDASWPADRIASVIAESGTELVIAVRPLPEGVATSAVVLDGSGLASGSIPAGPTGAPHPVTGADPYYVIYTSGSTGRPKGVQITAAALGHFVDWCLSLTLRQAQGATLRQLRGRLFDRLRGRPFDRLRERSLSRAAKPPVSKGRHRSLAFRRPRSG